jgi:hypothetical protein
VRENRPAGHAKLAAAILRMAIEATAARFPCAAEALVGGFLGHAEGAMPRQRQGTAFLRKEVVLGLAQHPASQSALDGL